ncbi:conserved hypothetical protein [Brachyspira murdochii DSM 12563]|uniref:Uncharacterized protein n=1 Tax=Brachyspira murdochii (strain ATCC 51284 / DSM 12563 / 56-150) TaxID=526224 RepID=D5U863_BRAM5|nr:conserved hypothetical protein [Brachyspira murdochii DSM 12563]
MSMTVVIIYMFYLQKINSLYNIEKILLEKILKKIILLFILILILSSCAAKVHLVEDSFYGSKFYQTDYVSITFWSATIKFRLRNISGTDNIILEVQYITDGSFNITEKSKVVLKFSDSTFLDLYYTSLMPKTDTEVIYGTSIYFMDTAYVDRSYSIQAENKITDMKTITDIRVETSDGFKNFKVKESAANDIIRLYNEMKELLSK